MSLACATATLAARAPAAPASASAASNGAPHDGRALAVSSATRDDASLRLGRAAMERSVGNLRGVVENLEAIDYSTEPAFPEADRAAFLLGQAYLELGGRGRFVELARQVATWRRTSAYTRWLAFQLAIVETDLAGAPASASDSTGATARPAAGHAAADALAAGVLLRDGNAAGALALIAAIKAHGEATPLVTWLEAQALAATGADDGPAWSRLAESDTTSPLGRDLAGDALIRLATRAAARGDDPRPLLARVPAGSRVASRARHMAGVATLERGDTSGVSILAGLSTGDTSYAARREVWLALAGQDLDQGRWESAHRTYRRIDTDWAHHRDILQGLLASADLDSLWRAWEANSALSPALMLDALPAQLLAAGLADTSEDLTARPAADLPALDTPAAATASPWAIAPPPAEVWRALAGSARDLGESSHALTQTRWAMAREQEALEATRRFLAGGLGRARREADSLAAHTSLLDSLVRTLAALDGRLRDVRDEATRRVLQRTRNLVEGAIGDLRWLAAMRHFHLEGPERERAEPSPQGYPAPDSVVAGEETLARAIQAFAERMAVDGPALIARSYDQAWRPGLIDRAAAQDSAARAALAWARALATSIDSTIAASSTSQDLRRLTARADSLARATESLRTAYEAARARAAHDAIAAALKGLDEEREAIDYGLAASAYGLGVRLAAPGDSLAAGAVAPPRPASRDGAAAARDTSLVAEGPVDELDEPEAVRWRQDAIALHEAFLKNHAGSPARGEIRFRLADLLLVEARREFREQMAAYVKDQAEGGKGGVPLPVLSHDRPLALYRAILAEDLEFEHRDAALFNAGMILADGGDPEAMRMFDRLVTTYPDSPYGQESYLRMGDMHFNARRYAESIGLYQHAAAGPDAGLQAIALYKTGWAYYNQDQYTEAAFAFGAVLDLYGTDRRPEIEADIEGEAETYLVHSLAGAGGASAFTAHFARVGKKPYEMRILMALGQHFRRFGQYAQATAADELFLTRYPDHADALLSAERLIDTHQRANLPDRAREARLGFSARFAPGSPWFQAQSSDSVRAAGVEFARTSLRTVAQEYHHRARTTHAAADWRAALELYEQVLKSWPDDADAPALALRAGEAGTQLGEYQRALGHYETAARSSQDSIAAQALWQRVAVTDAWYESTRGGTAAARTGTGSDSLARAVLTAADRLLERFPDHAQGADLLWREGNLAFAHGWLDVSSERFGRLATSHPGDKRAPRAAILRADALFRLEKFDQAGAAYEAAALAARQVGADSLRRRAEQAIPVAYYKHAESAVAADSSRHEQHAELFQQVATRWPRYEHAHVAQYRAGMAWSRAGKNKEAVRALQAVIDSFPSSTYVRDAHLEIAKAWEADGAKEPAAAAYARYAERYPSDRAADAWLKAADLYAAAGKDDKALEIRLGYIKRYPNDVETAMEVYEALAVKDLATVGPSHPISTLLPPPAPTPVKGAKGAKSAKRAKGSKAPAATPAGPPSYLAEYLKRAQTNPALASRGILAQVKFLEAEEARPGYEALRIRQPLPPSIAAKQKSLDHLMGLYRESVDMGVPEWAHASTFRIGEALVGFGDALEKSERPADLQGDGLRAYEDVLVERAGQFTTRGQDVWSDLLRRKEKDAGDDPWLAKARTALWGRLGDRFTGIAEADYPLLTAREVEKRSLEGPRPEKKGAGRRDSTEKPRIQRQEDRP